MLKNTRLVALTLTVALAACGTVTAGSSPDAVQWLEKMADAMQGPYKANYQATMNVSQMGQSVSMEMNGSVLQGSPKKNKMNAEMKMQMPGMGEMQMSMSGVSDGQFMWMEMDSAMGKQVMKIDLDQMAQLAAAGGSPFGGNAGGMDPVSQVREMTDMFDFDGVDVGSGKVTLRAAMTQETMAKLGQSMAGAELDALGHFVLVLDETSAFPAEMRVGPDAAPLMVMEFSGYEQLDSVDESAFSYTPPPGAQVMDLGAMVGGAAGGEGN
jgi:outer membrane lipoprotein-sorting protein